MAAHPFSHATATASGPHLVAQNEPLFSEAELLAADVCNDEFKAAKAEARNDLRAMLAQFRHQPVVDLLWRGLS